MAASPPDAAAPDPSPRALTPWLVLAALAVAGGFIVWRSGASPTLRLTNALVQPVEVRVNGEPAFTLAAGATVERPAAGTLALVWRMVPPRTRGGLPVGESVEGSRTVRVARGGVEEVIRAERAGGPVFAPLITNDTGVPLLVRINAGLVGAAECPCEVPPGARRAPIGYYPLFRNSTVEVRDAAGRRATFRDLGPNVDAASGAVGLRFGPGDLH